MYHVSRLKGGLTIATAEMPQMASVSVGLWVGVGGRYEPERISGVAHFIEHLLFKGTARRSAAEISQSVEGIGGYLNAFTCEETTCFFARGHYSRFAELLDVLVDMFLNSAFAPADIAKERDVIKEEIAMYRDQPHQLVQELLHETLWPNHPLGRPLTGTEQTLEATRRSDLLDFLRGNYVSQNTLLVVAGPLSPKDVGRAFRRFSEKFREGKKPSFVPAGSDQTAPVARLYPKATEQAQLALGIRACSRHDERRYALRVLNTILGENMSSRLFQLLREDKGLAYSICSSWAVLDDVGALTIFAGLDTDDVAKSLRLIARELQRLAARAPEPGEARRARDYLIGQMELHLEGTESQMNWMGESLLGYGKIITPAEVKERLAAVTPGEVRAVARDFFRPERLSLALVSPLDKDGELRDALKL